MAANTVAASPLTVTVSGELTGCSGLAGNALPGSTPGLVGPRSLANRDRVSPLAAGLAALTNEKSLECVTAGAPPAVTTVGQTHGITCNT